MWSYRIRARRRVLGGQASACCFVRAGIRAGRSQELKEQLLHQLSDLWVSQTGVPPGELLVSLAETPGSNVMEAGLVLPSPEQEAQWLAAL